MRRANENTLPGSYQYTTVDEEFSSKVIVESMFGKLGIDGNLENQLSNKHGSRIEAKSRNAGFV